MFKGVRHVSDPGNRKIELRLQQLDAAESENDWKAEVLTDGMSNRSVDFKQTVYRWSDLWSKKTGDTGTKLDARLAPHSVLMLLLTGPAKEEFK